MALVASEKSGELLSVKASVAECVSVPLVAVTIGVELPKGALPDVVTVTVALPDVVIDCGLNAAPTPGGNPEMPNVTGPEKAPSGVIERT